MRDTAVLFDVLVLAVLVREAPEITIFLIGKGRRKKVIVLGSAYHLGGEEGGCRDRP